MIFQILQLQMALALSKNLTEGTLGILLGEIRATLLRTAFMFIPLSFLLSSHGQSFSIYIFGA